VTQSNFPGLSENTRIRYHLPYVKVKTKCMSRLNKGLKVVSTKNICRVHNKSVINSNCGAISLLCACFSRLVVGESVYSHQCLAEKLN
jgi:hypothetical protein